MAEAESIVEATLDITITPTVERDYARRGVFPSLRLDHAMKVINGATGVYRVTLDEAQKIQHDAEEQHRSRHLLPRGTPKAYSTLETNLRMAIRSEERRGLWEDPGLDEAAKRMAQESPARFKVGEAAMLEDGTIVEVAGEYSLWCVRGRHGVYVNEEGDRRSYQFGYTARAPGEKAVFYAAHELFELDGDVGYLKLVA